ISSHRSRLSPSRRLAASSIFWASLRFFPRMSGTFAPGTAVGVGDLVGGTRVVVGGTVVAVGGTRVVVGGTVVAVGGTRVTAGSALVAVDRAGIAAALACATAGGAPAVVAARGAACG